MAHGPTARRPAGRLGRLRRVDTAQRDLFGPGQLTAGPGRGRRGGQGLAQHRVLGLPRGDLQPPVQQVTPLSLVGEVVDRGGQLHGQVAVVVHGVVEGLVEIGGHTRQRGDTLRF